MRMSFLKLFRSFIKLLLKCAHTHTHTCVHWSKCGKEDERGEHRTNSSSVYSVERRGKQRMTEGEKGREKGAHTNRGF